MDPRYPIGKFQPPLDVTPALRQQAIEIIAETPSKLRAPRVASRPRSWKRLIAKAGGPFARSFTISRTAISMRTSVFVSRSPKSNQPSNRMTKISGRNCRTQRRVPVDVSFALLDSLHESVGSDSGVLSLPINSAACSSIPITGRSLWTGYSFNMLARRHHIAHIIRPSQTKNPGDPIFAPAISWNALRF